jgi:hypothetical protein
MLLAELGLVEQTRDREVICPFAAIHLDVRLQGPADAASVNSGSRCTKPCEAQPPVGTGCASYRQHNLKATAGLAMDPNFYPNPRHRQRLERRRGRRHHEPIQVAPDAV